LFVTPGPYIKVCEAEVTEKKEYLVVYWEKRGGVGVGEKEKVKVKGKCIVDLKK